MGRESEWEPRESVAKVNSVGMDLSFDDSISSFTNEFSVATEAVAGAIDAERERERERGR